MRTPDIMSTSGGALQGRQCSTESARILKSILERLKDYDLEGKLRLESVVMKTHGGYADVFIGYMRRGGVSLEEIKVAVKRLRIHVQGDADFAKVRRPCPKNISHKLKTDIH